MTEALLILLGVAAGLGVGVILTLKKVRAEAARADEHRGERDHHHDG